MENLLLKILLFSIFFPTNQDEEVTTYVQIGIKMLYQSTDSAERDKCIGCEGLLAKRFRGNFSRVVKSLAKSGLFSA